MSGETKLTKAQRDMLEHMGRGHRIASVTNRTAGVLERLGLAKWRPARWFGGAYEITDAGREALKAETDNAR